MNRDQRIKQLLEILNPEFMSLENNSAKHAHHIESMKHNNQFMSAGESHYKMTIVSESFEGLSRLDRQRKVLDLLKSEFTTGLHALELKVFSSREYDHNKK